MLLAHKPQFSYLLLMNEHQAATKQFFIVNLKYPEIKQSSVKNLFNISLFLLLLDSLLTVPYVLLSHLSNESGTRLLSSCQTRRLWPPRKNIIVCKTSPEVTVSCWYWSAARCGIVHHEIVFAYFVTHSSLCRSSASPISMDSLLSVLSCCMICCCRLLSVELQKLYSTAVLLSRLDTCNNFHVTHFFDLFSPHVWELFAW